MTEKLTAAVIGFGNMGQTHAEAYDHDPKWQLRWICDLNPESRKQAMQTSRPRGDQLDIEDILAFKAKRQAAWISQNNKG